MTQIGNKIIDVDKNIDGDKNKGELGGKFDFCH